MNKRITQNILRSLLLTVIALSSGCVPVTAIPSSTLTPAPSQTPTATATPSPTNTPEPIQPKGILIYSDKNNTYSLDLQNKKATVIIPKGNTDFPYPILDDNVIYFLQRSHTGTTEQPHQIFKVKLDGTELEQLTFDDSGDKSELSGSTYGRYLAYVEQGNTSSIVLFDKNQKESRIIIQDSEFDFHRPSWSPDGKKIAFFRTPKDDPYGSGSIAIPHGHLLVYSLEDERIIDPISEKESAIIEASWSPDGKKIAINISDTFNSGIYILDIENDAVDKVMEDKFYLGTGFDFKWSPNGKLILFDVLGSRLSQLYLLELPSNKMTIISAGEKRISGYGGLWSPSEDYVAYIISSGKPPLPNPSILNIQNINTHESIQIEIPGDGWISFVSWISP